MLGFCEEFFVKYIRTVTVYISLSIISPFNEAL